MHFLYFMYDFNVYNYNKKPKPILHRVLGDGASMRIHQILFISQGIVYSVR